MFSVRRLLRSAQCLQTNHPSFRHVHVDLKKTLQSSLENYTDLKLFPQRISNCGFGRSFTNTFVDYEDYVGPNENALFHVLFSSVFKRGFDCLQQYLKNDVGLFDNFHLDGVSNDDRDHFHALTALRIFLEKIAFHESSLKSSQRNAFDGKKDGEIAALLSNHLLSCLVYGNKYLVSNTYQKQPSQCPCLNPIQCMEHIPYGVTGLGHEELWYGHPGIVLIPEDPPDYIPIMVYEDLPNEDDDGVGQERNVRQSNENSTEKCDFESEDMHFDKCAEQIFSQAITFAFHRGNAMNDSCIQPVSTLIPSLVLTPCKYYIVMYDYMNDILLSSSHQCCSWWDDSDMKFNMSAVLQMWMVLNYVDFVPGLSQKAEHVIAGSGNFHNILKNKHLFQKTKHISRKLIFNSPQKCRKLINKGVSVDLDEEVQCIKFPSITT